ncbi:MAG: nicotinate-nucleotide adenylyltransferase [Syntrophobacterales bacterium]|nr:nicotinate-nucleotide adenylyltransferase [Syntrophobacterales bacterium]
MKWGLFGGTFDPIHLGHLRCAWEILEIFNLDKVIFIPAAQPPFKNDRDIIPFYHREQMIKLAIEGNSLFSSSDIENQREGRSYSIDTIKHFLNHSPENLELYFILGQDAFHGIQAWKEWDKLLSLCNFIVITRPGYEIKWLQEILPSDFSAKFKYDKSTDGFAGPSGNTIFFRKVIYLDISSTDLRNRVKKGKSIMYLTPDSVCEYIVNHSLYMDHHPIS